MLYQTVRPKTLDDFIGNKSAIAALKKAVKADSANRAHCYLFKGPSGCGKTTLARIMAAEFGCKDFDIVEKNAASERGIDMARDLQRYAEAAPFSGGGRAVILDEVAALTKDAQNALLKTFEDIPEFAYYFLCTTNPNKLLETIRTRCEHIEVNKLGDEEIIDLLIEAINTTKMNSPGDTVIEAIVDNAEGCPRIALVLLEKQEGLLLKDAIKAVQSFTTQEKGVLDLCKQIVAGGTWKQITATYNKLGLADRDPEKVRRSILGYLRSCLLRSKGSEAEKFASMIEELTDHTYDSGEAGLVCMLFRASRTGA
ncbi:hypothetical protein LCGC14_0235110 [marine sediment metagenome]|uniref:AAA+ ATPase domain-containing protein n=1 Tax=marine sediment metagenome TaxID=412755 RepID=A0A0F9U8V8_9ZZZZ